MNWMFSCKQVSVLVSAALEQKPSWTERLRISLHLLFCKACRNFARQMTILRTAARHLADHMGDLDIPTLPSEARDRIRKVLHRCEPHDNGPKS